ncbi:DUF1659 domain-containing protein [Lysinibacillus fusiformis]|nr:DUF1659 domain-containing protein [Lysinibacillus fusiformis]
MTNTIFLGATLRLKYIAGHDDNNEPKFTTKTYQNLNGSHAVVDLLKVAKAIASLSSQPLDGVVKQETTDLS